MHDLSLSLGLLRDVIWWMWFVIKQIGIVENNAMENVLYCFNLWRLTFGIGNLMSSHSLSAGHVPLGLGRDIAGLVIGDYGVYDKNRDIIVEYKSGYLKRISVLHPSLMAMQYPILFPYGEDDYRIDIEYVNLNNSMPLTRRHITTREYYVYRI